MKDLTFGTLIAVFEEMFRRWLFWGLVATAVVVTVAYLYVLIRDRRISWRKFLLAQFSMPLGAVLAVWFVHDDDGMFGLAVPAEPIPRTCRRRSSETGQIIGLGA